MHVSDYVNGLKPGASGRNQAIHRLRDKNAIRRTQVAGNRVRGMYTILQTLCCCCPCLTVPSRETSLPNAAAENHFEDEEEDKEDFEEENENQNENKMDTGKSTPLMSEEEEDVRLLLAVAMEEEVVRHAYPRLLQP